MIDKEKTRKKCNVLLEAMVGPSLVDQWWDSKNKHWDLRTPNEVFEEDPKSVFSYLMFHAMK